MKQIRQIGQYNLLGIIVLIGITAWLVNKSNIHYAVFVLTVAACYPLAKHVKKWLWWEIHNPVRLLNRALPKAGMVIEEASWDDTMTSVRYFGKFHDEYFVIDGSTEHLYATFRHMPWHQVKTSDPNIPRILEAINDVNAQVPSANVILCDPNDQDERVLYTLSLTILPISQTYDYVRHMMVQMINCREAFGEAMAKERPYMGQRRSPVGFDVMSAAAQPADAAPAAKSAPATKA